MRFVSALSFIKYLVPITFFFLSFVLYTHASCGDFITEYDYGEGLVEERDPIVDCNNPFNADDPVPFTYAVTINGQTVTANSIISVPEAELVSGSFSIDKPNNFTFNPLQIFKHEGDDYRQVATVHANNFELAPLSEGEYVAVLLYELPILQSSAEPLWKQWIKAVFLPLTAYAFYPDYTEVVAIPFTVEYESPVPTGASSVLFLPGIMGSRLYEEGEFCEKSNSERQLWFSFNKCQQLRLTTNFIGQSTNQVYTKFGAEGILDEAVGLNLYKSFIKKLKEMKDNELIDDYVAFSYDWRGRLDDIIKSNYRIGTDDIFLGESETIKDGLLYKTLSDLAERSDNGKVTVVAHSNGGLVIKQLISNLQYSNDPLLNKIDNVILVAVPQIGSPKAALGILHGDDLDPVMPQSVVRRLMNTMPFPRHLLPVTNYFDSVETPLIIFEAGEATNGWIETYGENISSRDELYQFLSKDSGRVKPDFEDLEAPETVDNFLFDYAETTEIVQKNFAPSEGMKVYQIGGTGLETISSLTYFSDRECVSRTLFICNEYQPKISYRINMTIDGDETVTVPSALTLATGDKVERWWLNLFEYNDDHIDRKHNNILEVPDVVNFVANTIDSRSDKSYEYLSESEPIIDGGDRLIFQLHSPLDMSLVTSSGKKVSSSTNEVDSATYRRYGELQYISISSNEEFTLMLDGQATGSFTLDVEEENRGESFTRHTYSAIPSTKGTKVTLEISNEVPISDTVLVVDYDNDGAEDVSYDTEGAIKETKKITYEDLYQIVEGFELDKLPNLLMHKLVKSAEKAYKKSLKNEKFVLRERIALKLLLRQASIFERLRFISAQENLELEEVVDVLLDNK